MKKVIFTMVLTLSIFGLNGCGGGDSYYPDDRLTTLFLVDDHGFSYGGIPYRCDSMNDWARTAPNGEFTFLQPESCEFDFLGLQGDYNIDPSVDNIVRIVDYTNDGKGRIPYECEFFGASTTFGDGSFYYDKDDSCIFYL